MLDLEKQPLTASRSRYLSMQTDRPVVIAVPNLIN
jgi:hypothetical protein